MVTYLPFQTFDFWTAPAFCLESSMELLKVPHDVCAVSLLDVLASSNLTCFWWLCQNEALIQETQGQMHEIVNQITERNYTFYYMNILQYSVAVFFCKVIPQGWSSLNFSKDCADDWYWPPQWFWWPFSVFKCISLVFPYIDDYTNTRKYEQRNF